MGLSMPETLPCLRSKSLIPAYNTGMGRIVAIFNTVGTGRDLSVQYDQSVKHNLDRSINCILNKSPIANLVGRNKALRAIARKAFPANTLSLCH